MFEGIKDRLEARAEKSRVKHGARHIIRRIRDDGVSLPRSFDAGEAPEQLLDLAFARKVGIFVMKEQGDSRLHPVEFWPEETKKANKQRGQEDNHVYVVIGEPGTRTP